MKQLLLATCLAFGLASYAALAQEAAQKDESIHAPTNRLDKLVPPMKTPGTESDKSTPTTTDPSTDGSSGAATGEKGESIHPPTNRIDKVVPNMKSPNAASDLPAEQPADEPAAR